MMASNDTAALFGILAVSAMTLFEVVGQTMTVSILYREHKEQRLRAARHY